MDYLTPHQCLQLKETHAHARVPTYDALMKAIQSGRLQAIRPARDYLIQLDNYLDWLTGFPHKPGPKGN